MQRFKQVENGVFVGPQPTVAELQEAKRQGIATVVDFRLPAETPASNQELAKNSGLDYVNIPVDKEALSAEQVAQLDKVMQDRKAPFLLHCATGARAAMLYALKKAHDKHWNTQETFDAAKAMGFDLQGSPQFSAFVIRTTARPQANSGQ